MTIEEALQETLLGKKIKLPEWGGYWYREDGQIKVFCKNGDLVETPTYRNYDQRTDWQVTEGYLGFDFAILAIKAGHKVRRKVWLKHISIKLIRDNGQLYIEQHNSNPHLKFSPRTWVPAVYDLLAEDWEKA
jgi:hypothetical protein